MSLKASIIISFYNKIDWLTLVLAALERQSEKNFEVIIADDGSNDAVVNVIQDYMKSTPLSIQHVWHPDNGFLKTTILNKSVVASRSEYLIFIDGDCIPHKNFIEDHLRLSSPNEVIIGRRVNLSDALSKQITAEKIRDGFLENLFVSKLIIDSIVNKSKDIEKGIHVQNTKINRLLGTYKKGLLGCNFSISKSNLLAVNGFDERYKSPRYGEDTEIAYRFIQFGLKLFMPKFALGQYHLWHKKLGRDSEAENAILFEETKTNKYTRTPYGIVKEK
jgi:glycosyltransferase involved in cell wall biosynthesis